MSLSSFTISGKKVYYHVPEVVRSNKGTKFPLILFMCGTSCDPIANVIDSGWITCADKEGLIVISPCYNNYATYSETSFIISVVDYMIQNYPIDTERIYSTGFSNGGATSVALTSTHPHYFAAISAMGWMIDLDHKRKKSHYLMPFQVVQGDREFTQQAKTGGVAVMDDEQIGIRSLLIYNGMISTNQKTDYVKTPYWGYVPDEIETLEFNGRKCEICSYFKEGFNNPFAQFITIEDETHRPRQEEADLAWNFFKHFKRAPNGEIVEI